MKIQLMWYLELLKIGKKKTMLFGFANLGRWLWEQGKKKNKNIQQVTNDIVLAKFTYLFIYNNVKWQKKQNWYFFPNEENVLRFDDSIKSKISPKNEWMGWSCPMWASIFHKKYKLNQVFLLIQYVNKLEYYKFHHLNV